MPEERLLWFRLGREVFALRLRDAGLLVDLPAAASVPTAPPAIRGVADVRGRVVTLVSLTRLEGLDGGGPGAPRLLLLAPPFQHLALEVGDEVDLLTTDLERARGIGERSGTEAPAFRGLLTAEGLLVNLIDPAAVAAACARRVREQLAG